MPWLGSSTTEVTVCDRYTLTVIFSSIWYFDKPKKTTRFLSIPDEIYCQFGQIWETIAKKIVFTRVQNWLKYINIGYVLYYPILGSSLNRVRLAVSSVLSEATWLIAVTSYFPLRHQWYRFFHLTLGKNENTYNSQYIELCFFFFSMAFSSWQCYLLASINHRTSCFTKLRDIFPLSSHPLSKHM